MSQIKTTAMEGDVAVGRHLTSGGDANIRGNVTIKKNLKVEGWLDAKNIKGHHKGHFPSEESLNEKYPKPSLGWCALVGETLPALLYIVENGAWVSTGNMGGVPMIDSEQYNAALAKLNEDVEGMMSAVARYAEVSNSIGRSGGIAPLDSDGFVPAAHLPEYLNDVVEFSNVVENATVSMESSVSNSTDAGCMVVYDTAAKRFLLAVRRVEPDVGGDLVIDTSTSQSGVAPAAQNMVSEELARTSLSVAGSQVSKDVSLLADLFIYYANWGDAGVFGKISPTGRTPHAGKLYICRTKNICYRWSGSDLVVVGSNLALGYTATTAYPGSEGAAVARRVEEVNLSLENRISETETALAGKGSEIASLRSTFEANSSAIALLNTEASRLNSTKAEKETLEVVAQSATLAMESATLATQSVNAALSSSSSANEKVSRLEPRIADLESKEVYEVLTSIEEYEARKAAGILDATKLYLIPEEQ